MGSRFKILLTNATNRPDIFGAKFMTNIGMRSMKIESVVHNISEGGHAVKAGAHAEYYTHGLRRQNAPWTGVRLYVLSIERRALALRNTSTWVLLHSRSS